MGRPNVYREFLVQLRAEMLARIEWYEKLFLVHQERAKLALAGDALELTIADKEHVGFADGNIKTALLVLDKIDIQLGEDKQ